MQDLVAAHLSKRFDGAPVLRDFSARFAAGEITCIMGRSGCGKTTLLNILMGFLAPDAGTVSGRPARLAAVFQEDRLLEDFSAAANAGFAAPRLPRSEVLRHLDAVSLAADADKPVRELSGGMKRRVAIVRAVLADGELVLLDEPFKGLDETTRAAVAAYLCRQLAGKTVILVTHDEEEVTLMGGRLLRLQPEGGKPDED